jgi:magnesium transporter
LITAYVRSSGALAPVGVLPGHSVPEDAVWIDLHTPTRQEVIVLERELGIELPSREDMGEIEVSSRLYQENGAMFMTATVLTNGDTPTPQTEPVTFILIGHRLLTIRYADPHPFQVFSVQVQRLPEVPQSGETLLTGLLDAIVDRIADILERVQHEMNEVSHNVFSRDKSDYEEILRKIGLAEARTSRARESLVSIGRVLSFLSRPSEIKPSKALERALKTLHRDVLALSDHSSFLANNITFMLNTSLGMSSIEQTDIIKIFSVVAVVFLPPTLIASIYGMNFEIMPELKWYIGYPLSIVLMVISAILPYVYFKRKGWL